ncbi:MAG: class I SAM-dependent methyltransferase [Pseudomonadota bacterium]
MTQERQPLELAPNRDEQSRQSFASSLRRHVLIDIAGDMRRQFDDVIQPRHESASDAPLADGQDVHELMKKEPVFKFYSAIRMKAQDMTFAAAREPLERDVDVLRDDATKLQQGNVAAGGSLALNEELEVPRNVSSIDVHRAPGGYTLELDEDDVTAGALYDNAIEIFAFKQFGEDKNDIGMTMANYVRLKYPDFKPSLIVDCGCTVGHNTLPWAQTFPDAEVHGVDVSGQLLRYASARAGQRDVGVHFKQMNATALDYADNSVDVVFSSMFLHELPLKDIRAFLAEAYRVLKPGGLLLNMELPPNSAMGLYESFYLDWDSFYNNEPYYKTFRDQDYPGLIDEAGFGADAFLEVTLPRYTFVGESAFAADIDAPTVFNSQTGRMDPKGTRWYAFGGWKNT